MHGIEFELLFVSVPPLQGGDDYLMVRFLGLRAGRFTPSYNITGLRPWNIADQ